jgi:hypothetical protein
MFNIELLPKESVLQDILPAWEASGRTYDKAEGIHFEAAKAYYIEAGSLVIDYGGNTYIYNLSDFYRVKVSPLTDDMFSE